MSVEGSAGSRRGQVLAALAIMTAVVALGLLSRAGGPVGVAGGGPTPAPDPTEVALPTLPLPSGITLVRGSTSGIELLSRDDDGRVASVSVPHFGPGSKRLLRVGPRRAVLTGSDDQAWLLDANAQPPALTDLGQADDAVASAHAGRVWLVRAAAPQWDATEVGIDDGAPSGATVTGRLALALPSGPLLHQGYGGSAERSKIIEGRPLAAHRATLASCPYPCRQLLLRRGTDPVSRRFQAPSGTVFATPVVFAPDGRFLAAGLSTAGPAKTPAGVALLDAATGEVHRLADQRHRALGHLEWSPDGMVLFIPASRGRLLAWERQTQQLHEVDVPLRLLASHAFTVFQDTGEEAPPDVSSASVPDGLRGVLAITHHTGLELLDLVTGTVTRAGLPAPSGGDPPHRLLARDGRLVQWLADGPVTLDVSRRPVEWHPLIEGSWFVPGAAPDRVWVAQGRMGTWPLPLAEVDLSRVVHRHAKLAQGRHPVIGVGELLLVHDPGAGLVLWDPATGHDRTVLGEGFALDARGDTLAWCLDECRTVAVWRDGEESRRVTMGAGTTLSPERAALSPDGRLLAAAQRLGDSQPRHIAVIDVHSGQRHIVPGEWGGDSAPAFAWTPDSRYLVIARNQRQVAVWRHADGEITELDHRLPVVLEPWFGFAVVG